MKNAESNWMYDVKHNIREMKVRCSCKLSRNNKGLMCSSVNEKHRNKIFTDFWTLSWKEKRICIQISSRHEEQEIGEAEISRRSVSIAYHLKVGRDRVRVCKTMFLHTLCTGEWSVRNWLKNNRKSGADVLENNSRNENDAAHISKRKCEKNLRSLKEFFDQIPKMESHYCRTSTMKLYL
jgi:hypothetical protein